ncbi:GspH/FimT family pseudopilin [Biformimicrobium ophioploci]|uniref:Type II secretion system protein H n=1 Tax=Biformimicrobium ophioploci TaxID=3036711 RepID=A0ABQ6M2R2_9GAMM|nr:GspH/FimT family pseudopilin [Microbulbifer sp. NKW57]GMG88587.1 GspH/FimT family pseudopilin [Microbulbifer sp. NKW57]
MYRKFRQLPQAAGFTLIELMVTVTVIAILLTIGVPSFTNLVKNNRITASSNDLIGTLQFARAEAVRTGSAVGVRPDPAGIARGIVVWADDDGDGAKNGAEQDLREVHIPAVAPFIVVAGGSASPNFSFRGSGQTSLGTSLVLQLCDDRDGERGRQITVLASGVIGSSQIICGGSAS